MFEPLGHLADLVKDAAADGTPGTTDGQDDCGWIYGDVLAPVKRPRG